MWTVITNKQVYKALNTYPQIKEKVQLLYNDLHQYGPHLYKWSHFSKLSDGRFHCHLKSGRPTFVAVWTIKDNTIQLLEVQYVGTHENAPY